MKVFRVPNAANPTQFLRNRARIVRAIEDSTYETVVEGLFD